MTEQIINKVLRANPAYGVHKLYENGVEFYAPGWIRATIVAYDNENKLVYVQGTMKGCNSKKNVYNESASEIAKEIIDLLNPSKRLATMKYEPEKELFCEKIKVDSQYVGKPDKTLEEKLDSGYKKFIDYCEEEIEKSLQEQFETYLMYDDKYYKRTTYQPRIKSEEELQNEIIDNYKRRINLYMKRNINFGINPQLHLEKLEEGITIDMSVPYSEQAAKNKEMQDVSSNYFHQSNTGIHIIYSTRNLSDIEVTGLQEEFVKKDITYVTTPSKNYFLFKLS